MDTVIYYVECDGGLQPIELEETPPNFKDFLQDVIDGGYSDFKIYESICNYGGCGLMAEVKDNEIIFINEG